MSLARKYDTLLDPSPESPVMEPGESLPTVAEPICIKFCTGGVVSSRKWVAGYVTIIDRYYLMLHESRVRRWLTVSLWLFVLMLYVVWRGSMIRGNPVRTTPRTPCCPSPSPTGTASPISRSRTTHKIRCALCPHVHYYCSYVNMRRDLVLCCIYR
jgi:hypothetical protein